MKIKYRMPRQKGKQQRQNDKTLGAPILFIYRNSHEPENTKMLGTRKTCFP